MRRILEGMIVTENKNNRWGAVLPTVKLYARSTAGASKLIHQMQLCLRALNEMGVRRFARLLGVRNCL